MSPMTPYIYMSPMTPSAGTHTQVTYLVLYSMKTKPLLSIIAQLTGIQHVQKRVKTEMHVAMKIYTGVLSSPFTLCTKYIQVKEFQLKIV